VHHGAMRHHPLPPPPTVAATATPERPQRSPHSNGGVLAFEHGALLPFEHGATPFSLALKRIVDLTGAALAGLLTLPLSLGVALAIRLDSPGPVLFVQERVGAEPLLERGRVRWRRTTFRMMKFRSMRQDADPRVHEEAVRRYVAGDATLGDGDARFKLGDDPRVTRVGRFLRRTSLDELPQLLNVLAGSMSLVGPRPLPSYEVDHFEPWQAQRLCALPGITGLWQVEGRGHASFDEAARLDIAYVRDQRLTLDLALLLRTVPAVLRARGAR
jgi:lipopolysaccharide/colanic/teichoic acid biosynthesis glycosyltransferase